MNFNEVTSKRIINEGFYQVVFVDGNTEVLVSYVSEGVKLPLHDHIQSQVGYVISGNFDFIIDDSVVSLSAGASYFLPGLIAHGIKNCSDIIAIDFKFVSNSNICIKNNIFEEMIKNDTCLIEQFSVENFEIYRYSSDISSIIVNHKCENNKLFVIPLTNITVSTSNAIEYKLLKGKIYSVTQYCSEWVVTSDNNLEFICIQY